MNDYFIILFFKITRLTIMIYNPLTTSHNERNVIMSPPNERGERWPWPTYIWVTVVCSPVLTSRRRKTKEGEVIEGQPLPRRTQTTANGKGPVNHPPRLLDNQA